MVPVISGVPAEHPPPPPTPQWGCREECPHSGSPLGGFSTQRETAGSTKTTAESARAPGIGRGPMPGQHPADSFERHLGCRPRIRGGTPRGGALPSAAELHTGRRRGRAAGGRDGGGGRAAQRPPGAPGKCLPRTVDRVPKQGSLTSSVTVTPSAGAPARASSVWHRGPAGLSGPVLLETRPPVPWALAGAFLRECFQTHPGTGLRH